MTHARQLPVSLAMLCAFAWPALGQSAPIAATNATTFPATLRDLPLLFIPAGSKLPGKLTGDLSDPTWKQAQVASLGDALGKEKPKYETTALLMCDDKAIYVGLHCAEPAMAELKTSGGNIWDRDEVEIYLEPRKNTVRSCYHQMAFGAGGDWWAGRVHIFSRFGYQAINEPWTPKIETAAGKGDGQWTLEIKIPWDQLKLSAAAKDKSTLWRLNICRSRPKRGDDAEMKWSWTPLRSAYFHDAPHFGYLLPEPFSSPELIEAIKQGRPSNEAQAPVATDRITAIFSDKAAQGDDQAAAVQKLALEFIAEGRPEMLDEIDKQLSNGLISPEWSDLRQKIHLYQWLMQQAEIQDQPN